jgi:hypothetical protein
MVSIASQASRERAAYEARAERGGVDKTVVFVHPLVFCFELPPS